MGRLGDMTEGDGGGLTVAALLDEQGGAPVPIGHAAMICRSPESRIGGPRHSAGNAMGISRQHR
jgi:hypothetical protein